MKQTEMKEQPGTFDIIDGIPIVFAYGLPKPNINDYSLFPIDLFTSASKQYESSRQEWEVKNADKQKGYPKNRCVVRFSYNITLCKKGSQVQFTEIQPPKDDKRGKCKITKII